LIELQWTIAIAVIIIASSLWVYGDAKERRISDRGLWTLLAFFLPIAGVLLYLIFNKRPSVSQSKGDSYCRYCGKQISSDSIFCPYCGRNSSDRSQIVNLDAETIRNHNGK